MRNGWVRRKGELKPGTVQYPEGGWAGARWFQPMRATNGRLNLQVRTGYVELTGAEADGDDLVLTGRIPARMQHPTLRLARSADSG